MGDRRIALIWAMDEQGIIGYENQLPWHLPADMQWFRQHTLGKPVLMGRKTFDSIGKPLPKRQNIVLSRQHNLSIEGCDIIHQPRDAFAISNAEEIMVIGGSEIYAQMLPLASRLYYTRVRASVQGDAYFPVIDWSGWQECSHEHHAQDANNPYACDFFIYERRANP